MPRRGRPRGEGNGSRTLLAAGEGGTRLAVGGAARALPQTATRAPLAYASNALPIAAVASSGGAATAM